MRYWIVMLVWVISACSGGTINEETLIDYDAELAAYSTEAAQLRNDLVIVQTDVVATIEAVDARRFDFARYNDSLRQTVVAVVPPVNEERIVANDIEGPLPVEVYDLSNGEMRFVQIGPAGEIDEQGCFRDKQQFFRIGTNEVIYMTAVALNLRAGTNVRADWQYGSELVFTNSWVAPQSEPYRCIVLAMRPSDAAFLPGNWSVTLSVNGDPTNPRSFTILEG
ncbi:MAG: hypothetical protein ACFE0Q_21000 [Anaerolineae bacterium]